MITSMNERERLIANEIAALQGAWTQIALEADGVINPPDEHSAPGAVCYISLTHFSVRTPDETVLLEGNFEIDPSTHPKRIIWTDSMGPDEGRRLPAIYTLDVNCFTFIAADDGQPWPTTFETALGLTMRSFSRNVGVGAGLAS